MDAINLRVADIVNDSIVDGPGLRLAVFVQGCPHRCSGCHNPHTHSFDGGRTLTSKEIVEQFYANPLLEGITFTGGEPLEQASALLPIAKAVQETGATVWLYTGYTWEGLLNDGDLAVRKLLTYCDVVVDGRFEEERKNLSLRFKGSENQRVLDVSASLSKGKAIILKGFDP